MQTQLDDEHVNKITLMLSFASHPVSFVLCLIGWFLLNLLC